MLLIADSGSTKTSWRLLDAPNPHRDFSTIGYNPHYIPTNEIHKSLSDVLLPQLGFAPQLVKQVYFYGAGCSSDRENKTVRDALNRVFPSADNEVDHDMLAAARAGSRNEPGIVCILGTGSNTCAYDGEKIVDNVPSLGFIIGDEGSGAHIGRILTKAYFYRELPEDLHKKFYKQYELTKNDYIGEVYKEGIPSRYVAQFSRFCADNREHPFIQDLLRQNFREFLVRHVLKYEKCHELPIHYIGSVAFYYRDILEGEMAKLDLNPGRFIKNPLDGLTAFHQNSEK